MLETIRDPKLLARVKWLIKSEHAGFVANANDRQNLCLEPGCSCAATWGSDSDSVSGPFRDPPVRCTTLENLVLPLDPELERAYWDHLRGGSRLRIRQCAEPHCRREVWVIGPNAKYCKIHARLRAKQTNRERVRRYREMRKEVLV